MNTKNIFGVLGAILALIVILFILNSGNNTPISQWPIEGVHNLAFSIGWLSPFPDWLAYVVALLTIFLVMFICYKLAQWLYSKIAH